MADQQIVTSIVAKSDFSDLLADLQRVSGSLSRLQQEFAGANRALAGQISATNEMFKQSMLKTGQFSSHFVSLTSDVEKFGRNLDSGRLKLKDYFRVYQDHVRTHGGLVRDLAKQQVQLQNAVLQPLGRNAQGLMQYNVHIPRGLDLTKNKTALLKQELAIMNKVIQDGGVQLINWGKNTQWAGRQLTVGLTLPLVAFGKAASDAFKVADQELTRLTKVYGDIAGTSSQELTKIRKEVAATAKELSSAMGVNFGETIALAADIAATGKTGNELLASVSETTRLAVLGEVDRQEAMKATLAIQSAFKQNTDELAQSINFLNAVENQTSTTLNDLVEAIPKAGPVIKGLGGSVEDLALYLTAMREGGINASEGANALKSALASLINPTDVAVAKFQSFGIDLLGIVNKNAGDVTGTLMSLQGALDRLNPLQKQQAIEQLFGKFQFSRLNALFENLGRQGSQTLQVLDLMKASASELESVASRELAAVTESASGRYKRAVEGLKAELAGVGDGFLDIGTKLINVLTKIIDFGQKLPDPIKKLMTFSAVFTAIIGPVIMLTGVLANFFGYIIKGVGHFKALFKGAEGFRLLTPEIMAAKNASSMLGDEFYTDALAADTLRIAIRKLSEDLILLQKNAISAKTATSGLGQTMTTSAGAPIMVMGGGRVADPNNPLIGPRSRAAAHLNPRNPNDPATIFGLTLQPIPVNRRIGANPQILMEDRLDDIEGLTTIGGVSTGVVASEHARYQALMATLGLQSKKEIEDLKKTIRIGGSVSSEFMSTFDDILPITQELTANAARQSAAIVAELRAGKLSVQQARDAIIALNAQLERDLGIRVSTYGAGVGRTIDLTKAPLIDQPVVDASGKPNTRGMYRKGIFGKIMEAVGRATRTKTLGGPYSIETTRRLNKGGGVFYNNGDQVPGPNVNADVVPAMLTPGEFVIRRDVAQQDPEGMRALNEGDAVIVPVQNKNLGGVILRALQKRAKQIGASRARYRGSGSGPSTRDIAEPGSGSVRYGQIYKSDSAKWDDLTAYGLNAPSSSSALLHGAAAPFRKRTAHLPKGQSETGIATRSELKKLGVDVSGSKYEEFIVLPNNFVMYTARNSKVWNSKLRNGTALGRDFKGLKPGDMTSLGIALKDAGVPPKEAAIIMAKAAKAFNAEIKRKKNVDADFFGDTLDRIQRETVAKHFKISLNRGGRIPGYNRGGMVPGYNRGGRIPGYFRGGGIPGMGMGSMLASMLFGSLGYSVGSRFGTAGSMIGSMAGSMLPMMFSDMRMGRMGLGPTLEQRLGRPSAMVPNPNFAFGSPISATNQMYASSAIDPIAGGKKSIFAQGTPFFGRYTDSVQKAAGSSSKFTATLGRMAAALSRTNVVIGTVVTVAALAKKAFDKYNDTQRVSAAEFGFTAESAAKAGVKFTDYGDKIKEAVQAQKLFIQQNKLTYQNLASAGTPFKMSITEYKALKKEVKETMQAQIEMLNAVSRSDVSRVAVQLKEQFIAAGMSAEEATKKIFTLFQVSNKSPLTFSATGTSAFTDIVDAQTAAISALKTFNYAKSFENAKDGATQLNTALNAINAAIEETYSKAEKAAKKKNQMFDSTNEKYEAEKKALDQINLKVKNQEALGEDIFNTLAAQDPLIKQFANSQDTVVSLFQKMRIQARGFTGDLENLNATQTNRLYDFINATAQAVEDTNKKGLLKSQYAEYNRLYALQEKMSKAAKGQSVKEQISTRDAIRAIDEKIKKINEEADARRKALEAAYDQEDYDLQLQQEQLAYQQAVATGDMTSAAEAQLRIQDIVNQRQKTLALDQIEADRASQVKPLEDKKSGIEKKAQDLADAAALAGESLQSVNEKLEKQKTAIDKVNSAMTAYEVGLATGAKNLKGLAANFLAEAKAAGVTTPEFLYTDGGKPIKFDDASVLQQAKALSDEFGKLLDKNLQANGVNIESDGDIYINGKKLNLSDSRQNRATPAGTTFGADRRTIKAKTLAEAAKEAETGKKTQTYVPATGGPGFDVFEWNGKTYARDKMTGVVYLFNPDTNTLGAKQKLAKGGKVKYFGPGGNVSGPGTSTSDSIPAMLSDGEYVVRAAAVDHYGVDTLEAINAKKLKDGGLVGKSKLSNQDTVNLNGEMFKVNRGTQSQILADIKAAYAAEPNVKSFKDRIDYYQAIEEWNKKYSFVIPSQNSYPTSGNEYPLGSLSRFLSVAESQAAGAYYNAFYDANLASHAFKSFSPQSDRQVKDLLNTAPNEVFNRLGELEQLNKFSIEANKKYKLSNDLLAWCGAFIAWVAEQSGVKISKKMFSAFRATEDYKDLGLFKDPSSKLNIGDIIWWDWAKKFAPGSQKYQNGTPGIPDHVDIITGKSGKSIFTTIGGGYGGSVGKKTRDFSKEAQALYGSVTPEFQSFKDGGMVKPTLGTPDPNQSFINKLLFGTKYIGGNMKMLKGELPFGPGSVGKAAASFATKFKDFDIKFTPGTVPSADSVVGYFNNAPVLLKNYFDTIKSGAKWPNLTEHPAYEAGGSLNALRAYIAGSNKPVGELSWDPFSGTVLSLNVDSAFRRKGLASKFWEIASGLGPISHSAVRSLEGDDWARAVGGNLPDLQHLVPKMAGGGYVNPSYTSNMSLPSFDDGVNNIYTDMIAKVHKNEAVIPAEFNPWNPTASNPLGGTYTINNQISVQAAAGMNEETLANLVAQKIENSNKQTMAKIGINRSR